MRSIGRPLRKGARTQTLRVWRAKGACAPFTPSPTLPRVFHCEATAISRSDGRSAAGVCAYVSCSTARDVASGREFDFTRKGGLVETGFAGTAHRTPASFSAALDRAEKRVNSCTAREVIVALPDVLPPEQRQALAERIAEDISETWDLPVMWAIHKPAVDGDQRNHHVHYVLGTRDSHGQKVRAWNGADGRLTVSQLRAMVSERIQASVPEEERPYWDHRSHATRGIEIPAMKHEGNLATRMKRRWDVELETVKENNELRAKAAELAQVNAEFYELVQLEANRAIGAASRRPDRILGGRDEGTRQPPDQPAQPQAGGDAATGEARPSRGGSRAGEEVATRVRAKLERLDRTARAYGQHRRGSMARSAFGLAFGCGLDGGTGGAACVGGKQAKRDDGQQRVDAGKAEAGHRGEAQGSTAVAAQKWYASITDVIRAGIAEGRIPKSYVAEFTKYARATTFNERFMSQVPDPDKWTVQRERDGRIEYSPDWDKMLCEMMPPLITGPAKPTIKQPGRRV